ncbi:MAG: hypothetical protein IT207_10305 [Fimbriimonadaceae bacterium]|nr:hypothetical protein [Fimbriimonadaceae bacterium]
MKRLGRGLVGVLASVVILVGLAVVFSVGSGIFGEKVPERKDKQGETLVGRSILRAKDTKCISNLGQVRQAIETNKDPVDDVNPADLGSIGLSPDFLKCPIGKEPYTYDPSTGKVSCPHPGHEEY